ncbi:MULTISPECIES: hypothetical protein [unclassified Pseudomonas]|uniref:hypothetical protein n=1 Tax=unclassified Pseudomonas TaxID=196821 RepID=UPI001CBA88E3|nr:MULTISPECIES: hypothetical protein [unclassified Pseudomonas]
MRNASRDPMFICGIPITIFGYYFGFPDLTSEGALMGVAPAFLITGLAFMLIGLLLRQR